MELDEAVGLIVDTTPETPELLFRTWLDCLYREAPQQGLSSLQMQRLINFICESPVLSISTKSYIVDNFLLPNDYVGVEVLREVMRHLGTANAVSPYKLQVPLSIQSALCKWVVNIFFLLPPLVDKRATHDSIWIHLWQYDYLQKWLTYILVWSASSERDVRPWKIALLERVASKPGYTDAQACATLILKRYEAIIGESKTISNSIRRLSCNARRLRTLQELELDAVLLGKLRNVLLKRSNFTDEVIKELIASQLAQLQFTRQPGAYANYRPKVPRGRVSLLEIGSFDQLAWNWNKIVASNDVEQIVRGDERNSISLMYMFRLSASDKLWELLYDWITIHLKVCFKETNKAATSQSVPKTVVKICQIHPRLAARLFNEFLTYDQIKSNPKLFLYLFTNLTPLLVLQNGNLKGVRKKMLEILTSCHLDTYYQTSANLIPQICNSLLLMINCWFHEDKPELVALGLNLLKDSQIVLMSNLHHNIENRFVTTAVMLMLKTLPPRKYQADFHLKQLMLPSGFMNRLIIYDDPLLLDSCCEYLVNTKEFLLTKDSSNRYLQSQNFHIMDVTNYLWRNKILQSKEFLDVPTEFVSRVSDNLFLPSPSANQKLPFFSVTGIPSLSYVFIAELKDLESRFRTNIHYSYLIDDDGFKQFLANNEDLAGRWLPEIHNAADLKIAILRHISVQGPFKHIALFLFTYLKSLSHYMPD